MNDSLAFVDSIIARVVSGDNASLFMERYFKRLYVESSITVGKGYWLNINTGKSFEISKNETHEQFLINNMGLFNIEEEDIESIRNELIWIGLKGNSFDLPTVTNNWVQIRLVNRFSIIDVSLVIPNVMFNLSLNSVIEFLFSLQLKKPSVVYFDTYNNKIHGESVSYYDFLNAKSWKDISESVIDIPRKTLDPTVFDFDEEGNPKLKSDIQDQILSDIEIFNDKFQVERFFILGSILTHQYSSNSDIDVNVMVTENEAERKGIDGDYIGNLLKEMNGNLAGSSTHPINYYIKVGEFDFENADAAFDIEKQEWIKEPIELVANIKDYANRFHQSVDNIDFSVAELRRDLIDLKELKQFSSEDISNLKELMDNKLQEIDDNIESLITSHDQIKQLRKDAFERNLNPVEIKKYGRKNKLPENVIYKMMERYYYWDLIVKLEDIIGEDKEVDTNEVDDIVKTIQDFGSEI